MFFRKLLSKLCTNSFCDVIILSKVEICKSLLNNLIQIIVLLSKYFIFKLLYTKQYMYAIISYIYERIQEKARHNKLNNMISQLLKNI